jgi:hypothetical protein
VLTSYYDRQSPVIVIRTEATNAQGKIKPKRFFESHFPNRLTAREIDDVVLTLLEVASQSSPRAAFLYFYQIFEYAGHYYIDDKTRKSLKRLLRDPSLSSCDDRKVGELFSILGDLHQHDEQRMQRVVEEHCVPQNLWSEIQNDIDFFSKPVEFDGGLTLDRIVSPQANADAWNEVFKTMFPIFTKMRNCIVHAREKRESKVILPTHLNSLKLARFLPLIRRMAEDVAFRS